MSKSKQRDQMINMYATAKHTSVGTFYKSCSKRKWYAESYCLDQMDIVNGWGYKICGGNGFVFSAGFLFKKDGEVYLQYITKDNDRTIGPLTKEELKKVGVI